MQDEEPVETHLNRYRPAGPSAALRARVLDTARRERRRLMLVLVSALAAAVLIVVVDAAAAGARARVDAAFAASRQARERLVDDLTRQLGGDALARAQAEALMELDAADDASAANIDDVHD